MRSEQNIENFTLRKDNVRHSNFLISKEMYI